MISIKILKIYIISFLISLVGIALLNTTMADQTSEFLNNKESSKDSNSKRISTESGIAPTIKPSTPPSKRTHSTTQGLPSGNHTETQPDTANLAPFVATAGYTYSFKGNPDTFLEKQNPLEVSIVKALEAKIPADLLKAHAAELRIERDPINRTPIVQSKGILVPVTFDQLAQMKNLADADNNLEISRKITFILAQEKGDLVAYKTKDTGEEKFTEIVIYSNKQYLRDIYFPASFKKELDKYFGITFLMLGAKDRFAEEEIATGILFYRKAADISNNNSLVLNEAAKALLKIK